MPLFLSPITASPGAAYAGRWSPYSLFILFIMAFISLAMLAVFFILLLSGRFSGPGRPLTRGGLWQCLAAILLGPIAVLCTMGLESLYGQMVAFTDCTLLLLLLLAAQITMLVLLWRRQRQGPSR